MIMSQRITLYVLIGVICVGLLDFIGSAETPRESVEVRRYLSLVQVQRQKIEDLRRRAQRDSAQFLQRYLRYRNHTNLILDSIRAIPDSVQTRTDTIIEVIVAISDSVITAAHVLDSSRVVQINHLTQVAESRDSVVRVRDTRIQQLSRRKLTDYIHIGCQYGFHGPDCGVGIRIPLGR